MTRTLHPRAKTGLSIFSAVAIAGIFAALLATAVNATTLHAGEDFEPGDLSGGLGWNDSSWTTTGSAEARTKEKPVQGSWHVRIRNDGTISRFVDLTAESQVFLSFWLKAKGFDGDTSASVIVTPDGGSPVTLETWTEGDDDDTYRQYTFDLDAAGVTPTTLMNLQFVINGKKDGEKIHVDDIQIFSAPRPVVILPTPLTSAAIIVDGSFGDWSGQAFISDAYDDQDKGSEHDLHEFYWVNNLDEEINYHMIKRHTKDGLPFDGGNGQDKHGKYILYIDGNNDGDFSGPSDRLVEIKYEPKKNGKVKVKVRRADDTKVVSDSGWVESGETKGEGGLRVEFALDWNDLGISLGDVIRMYVVSYGKSVKKPDIHDRLPDSGDIQWSPASIFGPVLLGIITGFGILVIWWFRGRRIWNSG